MADTVVVTNAGERELLKHGLTRDMRMDLYTNNANPSPTSVASAFTKPTYAGYATQDMDSANWGEVSTTSSGRAQSQHQDVVFGYTGAPNTTIFGNVITSVATGEVLLITQYETPVAISGDGSHTEQQVIQLFN